MSLKDLVVGAVSLFVLLSVFLLVQHEISVNFHIANGLQSAEPQTGKANLRDLFMRNTTVDKRKGPSKAASIPSKVAPTPQKTTIAFSKGKDDHKIIIHELNEHDLEAAKEREAHREEIAVEQVELEEKELELSGEEQAGEQQRHPQERKGLLFCNGSSIDSEVIYWKIVPGDSTYESPITPHHADHHDKYLTFEYDAGGWNNVRMGMECLLVIAHATGNK